MSKLPLSRARVCRSKRPLSRTRLWTRAQGQEAVGLPSVLSMAEDSSSIIAIVVVAMRLVYRMLAKHEMAAFLSTRHLTFYSILRDTGQEAQHRQGAKDAGREGPACGLDARVALPPWMGALIMIIE